MDVGLAEPGAGPRISLTFRALAAARGVALAATIPAVLYFFALFMQIDCNAGRNAMVGLPREEIPALREEFWANVRVPGSADTLNQSLEQAGRERRAADELVARQPGLAGAS